MNIEGGAAPPDPLHAVFIGPSGECGARNCSEGAALPATPHAVFANPIGEGGARNIAAGAALPDPHQALLGGSGAHDNDEGVAPPDPPQRMFMPRELVMKAFSLCLCLMFLASPVPVALAAESLSAAAEWGTHDNTENVDGVIQLAYGATSGVFTSGIIDAGKIVAWESLTWAEAERTVTVGKTSYVGGEPVTIFGGELTIGEVLSGSIISTRITDGIYEDIKELPLGTSELTDGKTLYSALENGSDVPASENTTVESTPSFSFTVTENSAPADNTTVVAAAQGDNSTQAPAIDENITAPENVTQPTENAVLENQAPTDNAQPEAIQIVENTPVVQIFENTQLENVQTPENTSTATADNLPPAVADNQVVYSMKWGHEIAGVLPGLDSYTLKVTGYTSGDGESVGVYIWNVPTSSWELVGYLTPTEGTLEKIIDGAGISNYLVENNVHVKYQDETADSTQTTVSVDYCAVEGGVTYTSDVKLQVRVSRDGVSWGEWMGPDGTPETYFTASPASLSIVKRGRYFQYRVHLTSEDQVLSGAGGPTVQDVVVASREKGKNVRIGRITARGKGTANLSYSILKRITITPTQEVNDVEVTAEVLDESQVAEPLTGKRVYAYIDISTTVPNGLIEGADIEFEIPKAWMRAGSGIVVGHYNGSGWEELQASETGESAMTVDFSARTTGFSVFSFFDNENIHFDNATGHENTENVDNFLRLKQNFIQGRYTSRVFDAGGVASWDNLEWSFTEPTSPASEIDYVGRDNTNVLVNGGGATARVGDIVGATNYDNTRNSDGLYENIAESTAGGGTQYTVMVSNENETVTEGGVINTENSREVNDTTEAGGTNYENIYENMYIGYYYTYAQKYDNKRGRIENWAYQGQEGSGYAAYFEGPLTIDNQSKAIAVYGVGTETPSAKEWDGSGSWTTMTAPSARADVVQWVVVKSARTRNEMTLGTLDDSGDITIQIWNGSTQTWGSSKVVANVGTYVRNYRPFDIEYENDNDRAIVVYVMGNAPPENENLRYSIWNGTSWVVDAAPVFDTLPTTGGIRFLEMAASPRADNNDLALIYLDNNSDVYGMHWNGENWSRMGDSAVWNATAATNIYKAIDVAYEWSTGDAMFVWGDSSALGVVQYRTYAGGTLSAAAAGPSPSEADAVNWVQLVSDPMSDNLLLGVQDAGPDLEAAFWDGSTWPATRTPLEGGTEIASDQNFGGTFEIFSGRSGYARVAYGDGSARSESVWNPTTATWTETSWGGDADTARVVMNTHWFAGIIFMITISDDAAGALNDGIFENHMTSGGGSWSLEDRWVVSELPVNPVNERAGVSPRRHWPTIYGMNIYENIENLPSSDNYTLEMYYRRSNTKDKFHVLIENAVSGEWQYAGSALTSDTYTTFSYLLDSTQLFGGENVHIRIIDNDNTKETQTELYMDYIRVKGSKISYRLDVQHVIMAPAG
ncbi:MAG: PGF-pre-PGF domain-containing protein, partial [Candidatus Hadarchaeota archaeon]